MSYGIDQVVQQRVDTYRSKPEQLQKNYAQNQQLIDLLALQKIKSEKESAARQMQMTAQQNPQTIAQQREAELMQMTKNELAQQQQGVLGQKQAMAQKQMQRPPMPQQRPQAPQPQAQGIAGVPAPNMQKMAEGGVVGFNGQQGSLVPDVMQPKKLSRKEVEAMIAKGTDPKDIARITGNQFVAKMVGDRVEILPGDPDGEMGVGDTPMKAFGRMVKAPFSAAGDLWTSLDPEEGESVGDFANEFMSGFTGNTPRPPEPKTPDAADAALAGESFGVLASDQNKTYADFAPEEEGMGLEDKYLGGSGSSRTVSYGDKSPDDISALMDQFGIRPDLNAPDINFKGMDALQSEYGDKAYDWNMDKIQRTPEEQARIDEMLSERKGIYDRINDPERNRERGIINRLVAAGGSRTAGNMFGNMVKAGQKTENIQDSNLLAAQKDLSDFEMENIINQAKKDRESSALYGGKATQLGMAQDTQGALADAKMDWEGQLKEFDAVGKDRTAGIGALVDYAKVGATDRATAQRGSSDKLYQLLNQRNSAISTSQEAAELMSTAMANLQINGSELIAQLEDAEAKLASSPKDPMLQQAVDVAQRRIQTMLEKDPAYRAGKKAQMQAQETIDYLDELINMGDSAYPQISNVRRVN